MKNIIAALALVALSGCSTVASWIPSFNDTNQSAKIIDIRSDVESIDCSQPQLAQALKLQRDLQWFHLYSESSGFRHNDVLRLIAPMEEATKDWVDRAAKEQPSKIYCDIKKNILREQAKSAAKAVIGRF
jgi:hypothetical protein